MDALPNTSPPPEPGKLPAAEFRRWAEGLDLLATLCPPLPSAAALSSAESAPAPDPVRTTIEAFDWGPAGDATTPGEGFRPSFGTGTAATTKDWVRLFASRAILPLRPGDFDPTAAGDPLRLPAGPAKPEPRSGGRAVSGTPASSPAGWSDFLAALE